MKSHPLLLLVTITLPILCTAQIGLPNFSGRWESNPSKSSWRGPSIIYIIQQVKNDLTLEAGTEEIRNKQHFVVDGKPRVSGAVPETNAKVTSRANWDKGDLIIVSEFDDGQPHKLTSRFSLSGKVLTVRRVVDGQDSTLVFDKR